MAQKLYNNNDIQRMIETCGSYDALKQKVLEKVSDHDREFVRRVINECSYEEFDRYDSDVCEQFISAYEKTVSYGRMNFSFETNMPDSDDIKLTPTVDYFAFRVDGKKISIGCNGEACFEIENGVYSAQFRGLDATIESEDGEEVYQDFEPITSDVFDLISREDSFLYEVGIYFAHDYMKDVTVKNLNLTVEFGEFNYGLHKDNVSAIPYGENN